MGGVGMHSLVWNNLPPHAHALSLSHSPSHSIAHWSSRAPAGPPGRSLPPRPWVQSEGQLRVVYEAVPGVLQAAGGSEHLFWALFGGGGSALGGSSQARAAEAGAAAAGAADLELEPKAAAAAAAAAAGAELEPEAAAGAERATDDTFWLDSAAADRGRFSYMGGRGGPLWRRLSYQLPPGAVAATPSGGTAPAGTLVVEGADGSRRARRTAFLPALEELLAAHRCRVRCMGGWVG